ncbi:MAG: hypothetical protein M3Y71_09675 [Actinomycetota bacterium]|nr:hypothetical protein [Actinomycetota bacterium]
MFIAIAKLPEVPTERDVEFQAWFAWSNDQLRDTDGLRGRRLLRAADGSYTALVEHDNAETWAAMHATEAASRVDAHLRELVPAEPAVTTYEVVADLSGSGSCCGGTSGHEGSRRHDLALVGASVDEQGAGGCCC